MRAFAAFALLMLSACATTGGGTVELPYLEQAPTRQLFDSPLAVAKSLVGTYPETLEASPTMSLDLAPHPSRADWLVLTVRIDPVLDDSIAAEQWRALLSQQDRRWKIEELGLRRQCSRGPNNGTWGPFICP